MTQRDTCGARVDSRYVRKLNSTFPDSRVLVSLPVNNERSTRREKKKIDRKEGTYINEHNEKEKNSTKARVGGERRLFHATRGYVTA